MFNVNKLLGVKIAFPPLIDLVAVEMNQDADDAHTVLTELM